MSIDHILVRITASKHISPAELGWMLQAGVSKRRCALDADEASFSLIFSPIASINGGLPCVVACSPTLSGRHDFQ